MVGTRHILGLAIDDAGVVATELRIQAGRPEIRRTGEFLWEQELTAENAKSLGQRLHHFLREQGFSAKRAVVGLAAKWVLTKEVEAPPANPEVLAGMLSIQAERAFSLDADELIFDYCGKTSMSEKSQILLLAVRRQMVSQIKEMAQAAGLHVQAITLSSLACSKALAEGGSASWYGLYARPNYCEFWAQQDGSPRFIKHVPIARNGTPGGYAELVSAAVNRLVLLSPLSGRTPPYPITTYDASGSSDELVQGLGRRLGPQIAVSDGQAALRTKGLSLPGHPSETRAVAAAAVALIAMGPERPPVDFLDPRVGAHKKQAINRRRVLAWGGGIAAACVLGVAILLILWRTYAGDVAANQAWLKAHDAEIKAAQEFVDRAKYAASWDSQDPRFLGWLKELTQAFPQEPSVWAKTLILSEEGKDSISGWTTNQASLNEVVEKMQKNPVFVDPRMMHTRAGGNKDARDVDEFIISFTFRGTK
jgi:hypothetical protein